MAGGKPRHVYVAGPGAGHAEVDDIAGSGRKVKGRFEGFPDAEPLIRCLDTKRPIPGNFAEQRQVRADLARQRQEDTVQGIRGGLCAGIGLQAFKQFSRLVERLRFSLAQELQFEQRLTQPLVIGHVALCPFVA